MERIPCRSGSRFAEVLVSEVAERVRDTIQQICMSREITAVKGHVSADPVHVMVSCPPILSPAQGAQYLKGISSKKLQDEFPTLKKRYWDQPLWARSYVGAITQEQIKAYIVLHQTDTPDQNFSIGE